MKRLVIGIGGRSGSGKSTLVRRLLEDLGPETITLHTMDNYYLPREEQLHDEHNYINFDLPSSFYRHEYHRDLIQLINGQQVLLNEYHFNNKTSEKVIVTSSAPIILVEGLFVFHYEEIKALMNLKILVDISFDEAYSRRLKRDQRERNYSEEEIKYRYLNHVEPSFQNFIQPHISEMNMIVDNQINMEPDLKKLKKMLLFKQKKGKA